MSFESVLTAMLLLYQMLIEHWDGTSWSIVSSPNVGLTNILNGVAIVSTGNVWTVGSFANDNNLALETLTEFYG